MEYSRIKIAVSLRAIGVAVLSMLMFPGIVHAQFSIAGLSSGYEYTARQHSVAIGVRSVGLLKGKRSLYSPTVRLVGADFLERDPYNNNEQNYSLLSTYQFGWIAVTGLTALFLADYEARDWLTYIAFAPGLIINSRHAYITHMSSSDSDILTWSSIIGASKIDYFARNEVVWWRFKPGIGAEYGVAFTSGFSLSVSARLDCMIDMGRRITPRIQFAPTVGIDCIIGSFEKMDRKPDAAPPLRE